ERAVQALELNKKLESTWTAFNKINVRSCAIASLSFFCIFGGMLCVLPLLERSFTIPLWVHFLLRGVLTLSLSTPMLISTIFLFKIHSWLRATAFLASQSGNVRFYCMGTLISALLTGGFCALEVVA